jgi:hypothetical protein
MAAIVELLAAPVTELTGTERLKHRHLIARMETTERPIAAARRRSGVGP